ncbi:MAG: PD40 domain-containing protein [Flavobacteriales bacterium]|nr:PD40 domain-containing protein [Flavobacteriales bacterium]
MKKVYFLFSILFVLFSVNAQQVQWASKLIKYSSDLGGKQFGIKRILGKPDAFPQGGYSPNAWTPKNALDGREIVIVGFETPQTVKQVAIFENLNAGCVTRVWVSTDGEKFEAVWGRKPDYKTPVYRATLSGDRHYYFGRKRRKIQEAPDIFNPGVEYVVLDNAVSGVVAVKVEFSFALLPGQKQIDAIGISDSAEPIEPKVNSRPNLENLQKPTVLDLGGFNQSIPYILPSENKLFVTNYENDKEVIYSYTKVNDKWANKKLETQLNTGDSYNYIDYANENYLLKGGSSYTRGTNDCGFELFENKNGSYQSLGQLKISAYNNYDDYSDATMTHDLKVFVMSIETDFTQGGTDLYFATRKDDGTYGFLQNMGKVINSAADESMPQLLSDGKTLMFASDGFSSYGNKDIFVSFRLDDTWKNWSEPINLGSKINTNNFEGQPFYDEKNETLYFSTTIDGTVQVMMISLPTSVLMSLK